MAKNGRDRQINPLLIALSSLIGVVLGATLQYYITTKIEKEKHWFELRSDAYIRYVENTAKLGALTEAKGLAEARSLRNSARFQIALYGSQGVIQQMKKYAKWENEAPKAGSPEEKAFKESSLLLFDAMRNELMSPKDRVKPEDLRPILFPSEFSVSKPNG